jgi:hypothetical protein
LQPEVPDFGREQFEVELRLVEPPKGIGRLMRNEGNDTEDERVMRESVENGISVEGEFTFASAIANFTRKALDKYIFYIKLDFNNRFTGAALKSLLEANP